MNEQLILEAIRRSWSWLVPDPVRVLHTNAFGNVLVEAADGSVWRLVPEELNGARVARGSEEVDRLLEGEEFARDWEMQALVDSAVATLGPLPDDRRYCLKIPACLGGSYTPTNFGSLRLAELLESSGDLGRQIKDLPDGARVRINLDRTDH